MNLVRADWKPELPNLPSLVVTSVAYTLCKNWTMSWRLRYVMTAAAYLAHKLLNNCEIVIGLPMTAGICCVL